LRNADIKNSIYFDSYGEPFGKSRIMKYDYGGRCVVSEKIMKNEI
jgi:hypothetical protein